MSENNIIHFNLSERLDENKCKLFADLKKVENGIEIVKNHYFDMSSDFTNPNISIETKTIEYMIFEKSDIETIEIQKGIFLNLFNNVQILNDVEINDVTTTKLIMYFNLYMVKSRIGKPNLVISSQKFINEKGLSENLIELNEVSPFTLLLVDELDGLYLTKTLLDSQEQGFKYIYNDTHHLLTYFGNTKNSIMKVNL